MKVIVHCRGAWVLSWLLLFGISLTAQEPKSRTDLPYKPGEVLVRFRSGAAAASAPAHQRVGARVAKRFRQIEGLQLVSLPAGVSVEAAIAEYRKQPGVEFAEPNFRVRAIGVPNDPQYSQLWGMTSINAPQAWDLTTGSAGVVVAVLDTGIDYGHADLAANMFRNTPECTANGVDDDGNGWIDDCHGIDVINRDADPTDDHSHGTHVAGTIGAVGNNGVGVAGVNWNVRLLPCKFLDHTGSGYIEGAIECLDYIADLKSKGVPIVASNNSWGSVTMEPVITMSASLVAAVWNNLAQDILFVVAAGNDRVDNDTIQWQTDLAANPVVPNVIAVSALASDETLASFSSYGRHSVHIAAPGVNVLSTLPTSIVSAGYGAYSGTSMATPHVAGVAALLKAQSPALNWAEIKNRIIAGGTPLAAADNTISQRKLNAVGTLTCADSTVMARLMPFLSVSTVRPGASVRLSALHVNCEAPAGDVTVTVNPGNTSIVLKDDGVAPDDVAGDGVYNGELTMPTTPAGYLVSFPNGDDAQIFVLQPYTYSEVVEAPRDFTGTNMQILTGTKELITPFPLRFGGALFDRLYLTLRGNISFGAPLPYHPTGALVPYAMQLPAPTIPNVVTPWWDFLRGDNAPYEQNVYWTVTGTAPNRELVVEWRKVFFSSYVLTRTESITFQAVFFENKDDIYFIYRDTVFGGSTASGDHGAEASVGIQTGPDQATQYSYKTPLITDGLAIRWQLAADAAAIPQITSITPAKAQQFDPAFEITVTGANFTADSVIRWGQTTVTSLPTTYVSATELRATVPATALETAGYARVTVLVPSVGESGSVPLLIEGGTPIPQIQRLSPGYISGGSPGFTLRLEGSNFMDIATVLWNGASRPTTYVNNTHLEIAVTAQDLAAPGTADLVVRQGTRDSIPVPFTITGFEVKPPVQSSVTVTAGQTAAYSLSLDPVLGAFDRTVQFSCAGLPRGATCTFSPSSLVPGPVATPISLSIATTARGTAAVQPGAAGLGISYALAMFAGVLGLVLPAGRWRKPKRLFLMLLIAALALGLPACGGGGGSNFVPPPADPGGTPAGSYSISVRGASGAYVQNTTVTLAVQ